MAEFVVVSNVGAPLDSPAQVTPEDLPVIRVGAVQCAWDPDPEALQSTLADGIAIAADAGTEVVCLQELTLSPYFCSRDDVADALDRYAEDLETGPTVTFARAMAARFRVSIHASLFERSSEAVGADSLGFNTAVCVDPEGSLLARTRKLHIPQFHAYHEDRYFAPGDTGFPVVEVGSARFGFPTCWDQWNPELARIYSLAGAEIIVYPTAIGSEPLVEDFDTQPLWEQMIRANGLANATFMVAVNRIGTEEPLEFYGSSFVSDPYGRVLVRAPRDLPAVLVADLDLNHRRDWLTFGLFETRRPELYTSLVAPAPPSVDR